MTSRHVTAAAHAEVLGADALRGIQVEETLTDGLLRLSQWESLDPRLVCGITTAARGDLAVAGSVPEHVSAAYADLARELGLGQVSLPTQVHGTELREVAVRSGPGPDDGTVIRAGSVDGQIATGAGLLLAATAADCVPVYLWSPELGRIGLIHAGWRGATAGIVPRALTRFERDAGRGPLRVVPDLRVHLGPAICGRCYEVDEAVLSAFGFGGRRARLDLRGLLAAQAVNAGVDRQALTSSRFCTSCGPCDLHSHRASGGAAGRMAAFLGVRGG